MLDAPGLDNGGEDLFGLDATGPGYRQLPASKR